MNALAPLLVVLAAWTAFVSVRSLYVSWSAFRALAGQSMLVEGSADAIPYAPLARIAAEVAWAAQARIPYAVLCIRLYGVELDLIAADMRARMRAHEMVARFDNRTLLIGAWNVDAAGAVRACSRLAAAALGDRVVAADASVALVPHDGESLRSLIVELDCRLRPVELVHEAAETVVLHDCAAQVS